MSEQQPQLLVSIVIPLVTLILGYFIGYFFGKRQLRNQYITDLVKDKYPPLYEEILRNNKNFGNFLETPAVSFDFANLNALFDKGLDSIIKKRHKDLYVLVNSFRENSQPRFKKLETSVMTTKQKLFASWSQYLFDASPPSIKSNHIHVFPIKDGTVGNEHTNASTRKAECESIVQDLIVSVNSDNVLSYLLKKNYNEAINHIENRCHKSSIIFNEELNTGKLSRTLIYLATPEIESLLELHSTIEKEDKKQAEQILSLLQKYINSPI
jgi:uncharacterized protein YneF (UPF0154 family)